MINDGESLVEAICWLVSLSAGVALVTLMLKNAHWGNLLP